MADPVWIVVMFDLPVKTTQQRREANRYRNLLLNHGFDQLQLSVYSKYLVNASGVRSLLSPIKMAIPAEGSVRALQLTDTQWHSQFRFYGPEQQPAEKTPQVLEIFDSWSDSDPFIF